MKKKYKKGCAMQYKHKLRFDGFHHKHPAIVRGGSMNTLNCFIQSIHRTTLTIAGYSKK